MGNLTVVRVRSAKPGCGSSGKLVKRAYQDGDGLFLLVAPSGAKSWMLRVQVDGKRRDIGLGTVDVDGLGNDAFGMDDARNSDIPLMLRKNLSLAEAREKAAALRKLAKAGIDPKVERDRQRVKVPTFAEAVTEAHKSLKAGWSERTAKAFKASLEEHAKPKLGALKVNAIGSADVIAALAPIWTAKPVMARKVRNGIGQVLAFAKARGWRTEAPPDARELVTGLSKQKQGGHFAAMAYPDLTDFVADQLALEWTASRAAMLFAVLTASRSGAVRQAKWEQIDLVAREWHCPADIMKKERAHVVALSSAAIALLKQYAPEEMRHGLVFLGIRGGPLSDMSLTKALRTAGRKETVHGFRTTFRVWAAEQLPTIPIMVVQMALSHAVGTATDRAYLRTDMLEMRRSLMEAWGRFAAPSLSGVSGNVAVLRPAKASRVSGGANG